jgi:hypothetical protein
MIGPLTCSVAWTGRHAIGREGLPARGRSGHGAISRSEPMVDQAVPSGFRSPVPDLIYGLAVCAYGLSPGW